MGGLPISVGELQRSYGRVRANYERLYQGRLNEAMLRQMGIEEQVLESLVGTAPGRARGQAARRHRL